MAGMQTPPRGCRSLRKQARKCPSSPRLFTQEAWIFDDFRIAPSRFRPSKSDTIKRVGDGRKCRRSCEPEQREPINQFH